MRKLFWGALATGVVLSVLAAWMDWSAPGEGQQLNPGSTGAPLSGESQALSACESSGGSYIGPLVPDQDTPAPVATAGTPAAEVEVPHSQWSNRAGFSISNTTDPEYWADQLASGWYLDWRMAPEPNAVGLEYWPMVRVHETCISPSPDEIRRAAANNPGLVWIIGNEPDVIWQDRVTPAKYAVAYHDLYQLIKAADPTALVAVGAIAQGTPLRLEYLDLVLRTYQDLYQQPMPADWWTVHGYVLREEQNSWGVEIPPGIDATQGILYEVSDHGRLDLFEAQLGAFRQWMKDNGYQDTPLALTEFGILMPNSYGFPPDMIAGYLAQTFTWLNEAQDPSTGYPEDGYRLVQKWAWFSLSDPNYSSSNLADLSSGQLTLVGEQFRQAVSSMAP